jgi:hypothetical protein
MLKTKKEFKSVRFSWIGPCLFFVLFLADFLVEKKFDSGSVFLFLVFVFTLCFVFFPPFYFGDEGALFVIPFREGRRKKWTDLKFVHTYGFPRWTIVSFGSDGIYFFSQITSSSLRKTLKEFVALADKHGEGHKVDQETRDFIVSRMRLQDWGWIVIIGLIFLCLLRYFHLL